MIKSNYYIIPVSFPCINSFHLLFFYQNSCNIIILLPKPCIILQLHYRFHSYKNSQLNIYAIYTNTFQLLVNKVSPEAQSCTVFPIQFITVQYNIVDVIRYLYSLTYLFCVSILIIYVKRINTMRLLMYK